MSLIIGFGTGRCGSKSLQEFLDKQPGVSFSHERLGVTWDTFIPVWKAARNKIREKLEQYDVVGDISPMWINYISCVLDDFPKARFIWLDRDDNKAVVESYYSYKSKDAHIQKHDGILWNQWPILEGRFSKEAIDRSVCRYSHNAYIVSRLYPRKVYHLKTKDLVHKSKQKHLLNWVGIPKEDHLYGMPHTHKREDMLTRYLRGKRSVVEINLK